MSLKEILNNIKNKAKYFKEYYFRFTTLNKKLLAWMMFLTSPLWAPLGYVGVVHNKDSTKQNSVIVKVWASNSNQPIEYDTTDWLGRWGVSLDNSQPGETVYVKARKVINGRVYIYKLKDVGDGLGDMPEAFSYDSLTTTLYPDSHIVTFNIYDIIDTSNYAVYETLVYGTYRFPIDTTFKIYAVIRGKEYIDQDTMIVDTSEVAEKFLGDTLKLQTHRYDVTLPVYGLQHNDTFNVYLYKIKPGTNEDTVYETKLESLVYDTTNLGWQLGYTYFGDAYVWQNLDGTPPPWGNQYDTLYFPDTIYTIPHGAGIVEEYTSFTATPLYSNNAIKLELNVKKENLKEARLEKLVKSENSNKKYNYLVNFYENGRHSYIDKKPREGLNRYRAIIEYIKNNELKADTIKTEIYYKPIPLKIINVKDGFIIKGMPKEKIVVYDVSGRRLFKGKVYGDGKLRVKARRGIYFIKSEAVGKVRKSVRF